MKMPHSPNTLGSSVMADLDEENLKKKCENVIKMKMPHSSGTTLFANSTINSIFNFGTLKVKVLSYLT